MRVIGSRDTHRIREFLARNKVFFSWIDLESDSRVDALLAQFQVSPDETPVVICGEATNCAAPATAKSRTASASGKR